MILKRKVPMSKPFSESKQISQYLIVATLLGMSKAKHHIRPL